VARVTRRPIGSPLPLGALVLIPSGLLLAGLQLQWFAPSDSGGGAVFCSPACMS